MTEKHSPGPWVVSDHRGTTQRWNVRCRRDDYQPLVCQVNVATTGEEREANARLIAAAPELLAACKAAQLALRATSRDEKDYSDLLTMLRDAIAKATGK